MKRSFFLSTVACFTMLSSFLSSYYRLDPGSFSIEGECLYLQTFADAFAGSSEYVILHDRDNGEARANLPGFRLAYCLEGIYAFCDWGNDLRARFTYIHSSHTDSTFGPYKSNTLNAVFLDQGDVSSHLRTTFYSIESVMGHLFCTNPFDLTLLFGVNYSNFKRQEDISNVGVELGEGDVIDSGSQFYNFFGIGPEFGFDLYYVPFLCMNHLGFESNVRGALLVSKEKFHNFGTHNPIDDPEFFESSERTHNPRWHLMSTVDARISLNYDFCMTTSLHPEVKVGYAFIGVYFSNLFGLSFQGPFASLEVGF